MMYFSIFSEEPGVNGFFSTRQGGISPEPWKSLNFGGNTGDQIECARENRSLLFEAAGLSGAVVVRPEQVHGDHIVQITEEMAASYREAAFAHKDSIKNRMNEEDRLGTSDGSYELIIPETDAIVTNCRNVLLTTIHADCLPIYLYDRIHGVIGLAHAGWKGTCAGIGEKLARMMFEKFGSAAETMTAMIGPGISECCFEVGQEVYEQFAARWSYLDEYARAVSNSKYYLDLKGLNQRQLSDLGIREIKVSEHCTFCEPELFFSHRRDHGRTGRMGAGLCLID